MAKRQASRFLGKQSSNRQLLPMDETPTTQDILENDPETVGILWRDHVHLKQQFSKLLERFNRLDKRNDMLERDMAILRGRIGI